MQGTLYSARDESAIPVAVRVRVHVHEHVQVAGVPKYLHHSI
jgi:hypothetical protein